MPLNSIIRAPGDRTSMIYPQLLRGPAWRNKYLSVRNGSTCLKLPFYHLPHLPGELTHCGIYPACVLLASCKAHYSSCVNFNSTSASLIKNRITALSKLITLHRSTGSQVPDAMVSCFGAGEWEASGSSVAVGGCRFTSSNEDKPPSGSAWQMGVRKMDVWD
ncbi:hypothetical protein AVEN_110290-1 [Araneus ventricosus]|uniref:Uncharacterized protein n=1 Tax=Araneus ventricosus TaxID=182803 RepID=A0A4Y2DS25_ARAVE|nr:hypothetical protein AVEN_110290-1 [Araneus ventricosus]